MVVDPTQLTQIKLSIKQVIDENLDSVRIYHLGRKWDNKIEIIGTEKGFSQDEPILL